MFVFGGYIDMRGATNELWQYELGESVSTVSSLLTTVFESAQSMLRGLGAVSTHNSPKKSEPCMGSSHPVVL